MFKGKHILFGKNDNNKYYTPIIDSGTFKEYIRFIKSFKMLSQEEQKEHILLYKKTKDEKYREKVIYSNFLMVISISKYFAKNREEEIMDIIQSGNYGLLVAFDKYNIEYNVSYYTYASYWVRYYIQKYIETIEHINAIDHKTLKEINNIVKYINECFDKNTIPNKTDIIVNTGVREKTINKIKDIILQSFNIFMYDNRYRINIQSVIEYMKYDISGTVQEYIQRSIENTIDKGYEDIEIYDLYNNILKSVAESKACDDSEECYHCATEFAKYIIGIPHNKDKSKEFIKVIRKNKKLTELLLSIIDKRQRWIKI